MSYNPIKVLHVFGGMNRGGAETLIMNVYRNINREKFHFDFAVGTMEKCDYDDEIISLGGNIYHLSEKGGHDVRIYYNNLNQLLRSNKYDVIHSHIHYFSGVTLLIGRINKVPIRIAHSHSTSDGKSDSWKRILYRWIMRKSILCNATHLVGCSKEACEALYGPNCWNDVRTQVIANGIDLSVFEKVCNDKNSLREEIDLPKDVPLIIHVDRFAKPKNHVFLIEIFNEFLKECSNAHLVLVGDGPLKDEIVHLAVEKGIESNIHFLGVRSDIPKILSAGDIFLFPSLYEGIPLVLVEAQAACLPCLVSEAINKKEVDMGLGLIYSLSLKDNISLWVKQLKRLLLIRRPSKDEAHKKIRERGYSIDSAVQKLSHIYASARN